MLISVSAQNISTETDVSFLKIGNDSPHTEKELDGETGLTYFGARYLDAEVGMWTAVDPMGQYHHSYSFVGGDPVNLVDLWGLEGESSTPYYFPGKNLYIPSYPDQAAGMPTSDATRVAAKPPEPAPKPTVGQVLSLPEVHSTIPESKLMAPPPGHPDAEPLNHMIARELEEWSNEKYSETGKTRYAIAHGLADYYLRTTAETEREAVQGMGQGGTGSLKAVTKESLNFVKDFATASTRNFSARYSSMREARNLARTKLGQNPQQVEPGKLRSQNGRWQYRGKAEDLAGHGSGDSPHIHLERLNPETGEVLENWHLRW